MTDDLTIPAFLLRPLDKGAEIKRQRAQARERKIPYPKDGYRGKGMRKAARERLRASRRRHAEKCRQRKGK